MRRFRLAFWMTDPPGGPGDVVEVADSRVDVLVRAGIGHPEADAAPPAESPTPVPDAEPVEPPVGRRKTAKTD